MPFGMPFSLKPDPAIRVDKIMIGRVPALVLRPRDLLSRDAARRFEEKFAEVLERSRAEL